MGSRLLKVLAGKVHRHEQGGKASQRFVAGQPRELLVITSYKCHQGQPYIGYLLIYSVILLCSHEHNLNNDAIAQI